MISKLKKWIKKFGGKKAQGFVIWILTFFHLNNKIILFSNKKAVKNHVNINYWSDMKNVGDIISPVLVEFAANHFGIDVKKSVSTTKHLYAVGSIITAGCQDCTVWGSGLLNVQNIERLRNRKIDVRSVRGPLTRIILNECGLNVPPVYGDPSFLMPLIYNPDVSKKYNISVITHMNEQADSENVFHRINIVTDDYKFFIEEIKSSELIISSSLHGVILAELYGVDAILLKPKSDLFKYYDYYYSTKRFDFPIANSIDEALTMTPPEIPDFAPMQESILKAFPKDLWN